jgi:citrate synthase
VASVEQDGFDNQPEDYLPAREAAALLGVRRPTLYAYVSRGLLRCIPAADGRGSLYLREDLLLLRARARARSGHGPVAGAALLWGEPVLESALTRIGEDGPSYRGRPAVALARADTPFEAVAELLFGGALPKLPPRYQADHLGVPEGHLLSLLSPGGSSLHPLQVLVAALHARGAGESGPRQATEVTAPLSRQADLGRAKALIRRLAASLSLWGARLVSPGSGPLNDPVRRAFAALAADSLARAVAIALGGRQDEEAARRCNRALVVCADHELNVSTFAARVVASAGADLHACVGAALCAFSGRLHGAAPEGVEALVAEVVRSGDAHAVLRQHLARGEQVACFGHRLYKGGDPRAQVLLEDARKLAGDGSGAELPALLSLVAAGADLGLPPPTLDVGLVALTLCLGLPPGSATGLFAIGRSAGWIAHVLEQREAGVLLRPRARYIGE